MRGRSRIGWSFAPVPLLVGRLGAQQANARATTWSSVHQSALSPARGYKVRDKHHAPYDE